MQNLPVDLIRPIFQQVQDRKTLLSLCLSSKILQIEAQRALYLSPSGLRPSPIQHILFLTSLLHNPHLALIVKVYHIMLISGKEKDTFWQLLPTVLPTMSNLKVFSISASREHLSQLPLDKLVFQLDVLSWIQIDGGDSQHFAHWLDSQKALKELKWICRNAVAVSPIACPHLISLEGNHSVIAALLPTRRIKRLHWLSDSTFKGCHLAPLLTEFRSDLHFESLSFERHSEAIDYRLLVDHLPSLTSLEFIGDGKEFIDDIPIPPNLKVLILSITKGYGSRRVFPMTERVCLIGRLFSESLTLVRVDVAAKMIGGELFYERWENGIRSDALVPSMVVLQGYRILMDTY
ncbi:hypothetical protein BDN70DRAFT_919495 [Pholiota conissans]|uniref:Uncharacterized protein n=1 Tax=Pholiota conissans TaxID=109636 RepID=A0A9P6D3T1_9AGAR|nr:hypothetical protein BDN70DRAFT_919495 [Pholiota conissans]